MEPDRPLYTQALQIAALESLTYALDCSQLPADEAHSTQQPSTGYAYCPGGHGLHSRSPCLGSPASVSSHPYAHRYNTACVTNRRLHVHTCLFHRQNNTMLHACSASAPSLQHACSRSRSHSCSCSCSGSCSCLCYGDLPSSIVNIR